MKQSRSFGFHPREKNKPEIYYESFFEKNIVKTSGCWNWIGQTNNKGYGWMCYRSSPTLSHRFSMMKKHGPIPKGIFVLHKCDNPRCCNPDHLFLGTQKDNMRDCSKKGRMHKQTFCKIGHPKTKENTYVSRKIKETCLTCRRESHKIWARKKRAIMREIKNDIGG